MEIRDEILPEREVYFAKTLGPYAEKAPQAWRTIWQWAGALNISDRVTACVGFGLDNPRLTPPQMLRYFACLEIDGVLDIAADSPVERMTLSGGRCAVHRMKGDYANMPSLFQKLHDEELGKHGFVPDYARPFLEIYLNSPDEVGLENALTDLCVPIREEVA